MRTLFTLAQLKVEQKVEFSSLPSRQSVTPSQRLEAEMHWPLPGHWTCPYLVQS